MAVGRVAAKRCVDCVAEGISTSRRLYTVKGRPVPGPRCATHHRARRAKTRKDAQARRLEAVYQITEDEYQAIYTAQGSVCDICQRARGTGRLRLAVDHDHASGYVRGLLCKPCNRMLGHLRDDPDAFERAAGYLRNPPAFDVIGMRVVSDHEGSI